MGIGSINKNNFDWRNQLKQFADINKKYAQQTKQAPDSISQKTETTIKDSVEISMDGRQRAGEPKDELAEMASRYQELMEQLENAREQGEAMADSIKVRMKCLLIAMRIMSGDNVPSQDYRYLAKNDLELYAKAVSLRTEKENPKKHKRVSEDEESGGQEEASHSASTASIRTGSGEIQAEANTESAESSETS